MYVSFQKKNVLTVCFVSATDGNGKLIYNLYFLSPPDRICVSTKDTSFVVGSFWMQLNKSPVFLESIVTQIVQGGLVRLHWMLSLWIKWLQHAYTYTLWSGPGVWTPRLNSIMRTMAQFVPRLIGDSGRASNHDDIFWDHTSTYSIDDYWMDGTNELTFAQNLTRHGLLELILHTSLGLACCGMHKEGIRQMRLTQ